MLPSIIPKPPVPGNPAMADPGTFATISTENDLAATSRLITVILRKLVTLPLPSGPGTNPDFGLNSHHIILVLEDEWGTRFSPLSLLALDRVCKCECGSSSGMKVLNLP